MTTKSIYEQRDQAFSRVSAYTVARHDSEGAQVATIAFHHPRDGAGRLYAYVSFFGVPTVRGFARGGGYDKQSRALAGAAMRLDSQGAEREPAVRVNRELAAFIEILARDDGSDWRSRFHGSTNFRLHRAI